MARYKEYNYNRVLDIAMNLFWKNGFAATSVKELTEAMRINKFTLYDAFGNKEELLVKCIQHYRKQYCNKLIESLNDPKADEYTLISFFEGYFEHAKKQRNGCFILSIATETGDRIKTVVRLLDDYMSEVENAFKAVVSRMLNEENAEEIDLKSTQLHHLFLSLMLVSSIRSHEYCTDFMRQTISMIDLKASHAETSLS